jgi:4-hydroxythreonine-4-phosphate dehydrogenase
LHETDLWKDEARAPQSEVSALLAEAGLSCRVIDTATVRRSLSALQNAMAKFAHEADVVLCDAESDDDLRAIAEASMLMGQGTLWAGSAGLASHLPGAAGIVGTRSATPLNFAAGPTLFVVGSSASATREQASRLAAMRDVVTVRVAPAMFLNSQATASPILEELQSNRDVLVLLDESERYSADETQSLTRALSKMIAPCVPVLGGLVATGGETARAILDDLGIQSLRLLGEVEPGLPFSVADKWPQFPVLTKAGAFGSPQTLVCCRDFLQKLARTSRSEAKRPMVSRES